MAVYRECLIRDVAELVDRISIFDRYMHSYVRSDLGVGWGLVAF